LVNLKGVKAEQVSRARLCILFSPGGASIESLNEGIALKARGGQAPLRWIANGVLPP